MKVEYSILQKLKYFHRSYCVNLNRHVYDDVMPFQTNKQLANYLCDNILYNKHGIIAVNKPYGICFSRDGPQWKKDLPANTNRAIKHKLADSLDYNINYGSSELDKVNLHEALPYMKANLNSDSLCIIRSPEKYTTGICILGESESVRTKIQKCYELSKSQKFPIDSYFAICSGIPLNKYTTNVRIGITLDVAENGKSKKAILTKSYSKNSILKSKVKVATVSTSLLSTNSAQLASLIEISCNQKKWHFVRLFLAAQLLSPAIGDHLYGSRVKRIMGKYIPIHHWNDHSALPQKLPKDLLMLLDLQPGSEKYIPTMIHLSEVNLTGFLNNSKNLTLSAPTPSHFNWTIDKLGLEIPGKATELENTLHMDSISAVN